MQTPLSNAVSRMEKPIVELLLQHGARIDDAVIWFGAVVFILNHFNFYVR